MTWDGIPCLYYGTEQGFAGGTDPKNREDLFGGNPALGYAPFATDHETFRLVQGLIAMRKENVALRRGTVAPVWATTQGGARRDAGIFAFERTAPEQKALVVLNASGQMSESCAPVTEGGACLRTTFPSGTVLTDAMPGGEARTFTVRSDGTIAVTVPARSGRVLVKR
jgi:alpha-amylase